MNCHEESEADQQGIWVIPSLFVTVFASYPTGIAVTLLLVEIGQHFDAPIGLTGQLMTVSSIVSLVTSLLMSVLSLRYRHKSLLIAGLVLLGMSAMGCGLSTSFAMMICTYALTGLGVVMVTPMAMTLVAEWLPEEKRSGGVGWLNAGGGLSAILGAAAIGSIASVGGWRAPFLGYALPLIALGLLASWRGLPEAEEKPQSSQTTAFTGFKEVFSNRSALACLAGSVLANIANQGLSFFGVSFMKQEYDISAGLAALVFSAMCLGFSFGSVLSVRFVNRYGRKTSTIFGTLAMSACTVLALNAPNSLSCISLSILGLFLVSFRATGVTSLVLEQVPEYRGSFMSINRAAVNLGTALGSGIGGLILQRFNWAALGLTLGVIGAAATGVYSFFVSDPTGARQAEG